MDSLAAVDWAAYEHEALTAIADGALEDARVRYLGRSPTSPKRSAASATATPACS